jgi:heme-degrading monooxygenase HmoA
MIIRVYRCTVVAGKEAEYKEFADNKGHPWLRDQPGLIAFYAGKALPESNEHTRCIVQIWESISSIQAAIGDDWRQPYLPDESRAFVKSASVEHYELADDFRAAI